jgi:hypothetical protein
LNQVKCSKFFLNGIFNYFLLLRLLIWCSLVVSKVFQYRQVLLDWKWLLYNLLRLLLFVHLAFLICLSLDSLIQLVLFEISVSNHKNELVLSLPTDILFLHFLRYKRLQPELVEVRGRWLNIKLVMLLLSLDRKAL